MTTLITGGPGKTGSRVTKALKARGIPVRPVSRRTTPSFDWTDPATWSATLDGCSAAYVTFQPDLGFPGADEVIGAFAAQAVSAGVSRLVLLSGRGEDGARLAEEALMASGADWTIVRSAFFMQNFTEADWAYEVAAGQLTMVRHDVGEPFVDAEDVARVAVAALTDDSHVGRTYELTGPRTMTFREVAADIGAATGRPVEYVELGHDDYVAHLVTAGQPEGVALDLAHLFAEVLDGRNDHVTADVANVTGVPARDFTEFASRAAETEVWHG